VFAAGDVVVRREVCLGAVWFAMPTICVVDSPELLVLYVVPGTEFGFPAGPHPLGAHPWTGTHTHWTGPGKLMLQVPGVAHSVDVYWTGPDRTFAGWYFDLRDPFRRTPIGIDTYDHELDLWWPAGEPTYQWKDVELFEERVVQGRYPGFDDEIRAEGRRVAAALDAGQRWWDAAWAAWAPDPAWSVPSLPAGWDSEPPTVRAGPATVRADS
jgi:hypothetical protein